ncbi:MAG: 30S ribosomal protein S17 [Solirubrobacterales bacterium]|nr:30S ribosomal protein S17 [Solirubrobacterales bacterium]
MADETETNEAETPAPEASAPEAEAPTPEAEAEAPAPEAEAEAPAPEAEAEAPVAEEPSEPAAEAEAPVEDAPPIVPLTAKERKEKIRQEKIAKAGVKPQRSAQERQSERDETRAAKAKARSRRRQQERAKYQAAEHDTSQTPPREHVTGSKQTRQGVVVSDRAEKTITVRIDISRQHRKYKKIVRSSMTLHAHDASNDANIGDTVTVQECRPLSATKRWRLVEVVERAK